MRCSVNLFALTCLIGLILGCGKAEKTSGIVSGDSISVFSAPDETVIAKVGEKTVTVGDFRRRYAFETGVYRYTIEHAKTRPPKMDQLIAHFENTRLGQVLPQLVHCALLNAYLERECGGASVSNAATVVEKTLATLGPKVAKMDAREFEAAFGVPRDYFIDQILVEARERKAREHFDPSCTVITEKDIADELARIDANSAFAVASNRVTWASCSNALARVRGGEDFVAVGMAVGDVPAEAKEWGDFNREEIENAALRKWAFSAKVGEIGGPFDIEDGLSIVKVLGHTAGTEKESVVSTRVEEVTLARINFPMLEEHPEPRTREYARQQAETWKPLGAQKRLFEKLFAETEIAYPNGAALDFKRKEEGK